eukprot:TRINITY_DN7226_c3_g1_i3.p1 TRINITY_DN7226_c3_g1~~TRINITY_DN7226_c3_g1_i3.p1  ORF type:complete len:258 (-),score=48.13 TRINITY_DN7226_c3_g1_i3:142-915(-)
MLLPSTCPLLGTDEYVANWNDMQKLWEYVYASELGIDPVESRCFLSVPVNISVESVEIMTEHLMEGMGLEELYINLDSMIGLFAAGRTTGIAIDCGHYATRILPVVEGYPLRYASDTTLPGGKAITESLHKSLQIQYPDSNISVPTAADIKQRLCYVVLKDYADELAMFDEALTSNTTASVKSSFHFLTNQRDRAAALRSLLLQLRPLQPNLATTTNNSNTVHNTTPHHNTTTPTTTTKERGEWLWGTETSRHCVYY